MIDSRHWLMNYATNIGEKIVRIIQAYGLCKSSSVEEVFLGETSQQCFIHKNKVLALLFVVEKIWLNHFLYCSLAMIIYYIALVLMQMIHELALKFFLNIRWWYLRQGQ